MSDKPAISALFYVAGVYDLVLGAAFLLAPLTLYNWAGIPPANHIGYVQFPAALLVIFGLMFLSVARNPVRNCNLIPYGVLLKAAYCAVVFGHWFTHGLPDLWKPFALADLVFAVCFVWAYTLLAPKYRAAATSSQGATTPPQPR